MSNGYLKTLLKYVSSVYELGTKIKDLKDKRSNPKISTTAISFVLLFGFMLKIRSFNQLDDWLEHGDFNNIVPKKLRLPRVDAIRDSLKCFDMNGLEYMHDSIIRESKNNKLFRDGTIDGYKVIAIDGVEMFESTKKSCPNCLTRIINEVPHYFHRSVFAAYVGKDPNIVLGQEMLKPKEDSSKKDEGEISAAKRLMEKLHKKHRHFADVVVYDALACTASWINTVTSYNMDSVVRVKNKRLNIVKNAIGRFKKRQADNIWDLEVIGNKQTTVSAWSEDIKMSGVQDTVRFVKFIERTKDLKTGKIEVYEIWIVTTAKNMNLETLRKIIHARWKIENNIFRQLKTQWHMITVL